MVKLDCETEYFVKCISCNSQNSRVKVKCYVISDENRGLINSIKFLWKFTHSHKIRIFIQQQRDSGYKNSLSHRLKLHKLQHIHGKTKKRFDLIAFKFVGYNSLPVYLKETAILLSLCDKFHRHIQLMILSNT